MIINKCTTFVWTYVANLKVLPHEQVEGGTGVRARVADR